MTAIRLEGFAESVDLRAMQLREVLSDYTEAVPLEQAEGEDMWNAIREVRPLADAETLWRVHIAPSRAAPLVAALYELGAEWLLDWAGALIWIGAPAGVDVRAVVGRMGGHAMLLRAPLALRQITPVRHPQAAGVAALSTRVQQGFDPAGILDPKRFI
ncbi:MAG: hypothetical protein Q8R44_01505 [Novosphingobium sp.]|nr:hypothetical protein [Novosphingobium sp.]